MRFIRSCFPWQSLLSLLASAAVVFVPLRGQPAAQGESPAAANQAAKGRGKKGGAVAKDGKPAEPVLAPPTPEVLKAEVTAPDEFEVSVFATPQQANYPVFVAASPEGT